MEYIPKYSHPFTFEQALAFDPQVVSDGESGLPQPSQTDTHTHIEIARLENSISHLRRTQDELAEYASDPDVSQAVEENNITMHVPFLFPPRFVLWQNG